MTNKDNYQKVGVEVDQQSFAQLAQKTNEAATAMSRLTQANQQITDSANQAGTRLQQAFRATKTNIDANIDAIQELRKQLTGMAEDSKEWDWGKPSTKTNGGASVYTPGLIKPEDIGYGAAGGMIGPALPPGAGGGDNSGGGGFQLSGARRAGAFLNRVGLPEIGQPLQLIGGLQSVEKLTDSLGASLKNTVPAFAALDAGLVGTAAVLAPLAILVGGVVIGIKLYNDGLEASAKALDNARVALDTYYKAIESGTTDSVEKQLNTLKSQKANIDAEVANIKGALDQGFKNATQNFGGDLGGRLATGVASATNEQFRKLGDRLNELQKQSGDLDNQMQGLGLALDSAAVKANDLAEATLKLADQNAATQIESYKLIREGTSKQVQSIIDDNKDKIQAYTAELTTLQGIKNPNDDVKKRIADLYDQLNQLSLSSANLTQNVLPLIKARETEAAALKDLNTQVQAAQKARDEMAAKEVASVDKYNAAVQAANDTADQARLSAAQKLNDALVNAAQAAVDAASKALETLQQKQADNLSSLDRDLSKLDREANDKQLTDQIAAQRQERDDLQAHLTALQQIRDRDKSRERDDLLNRNYRDLFALKEQQNKDIGNENDKYAKQEAARKQAFTQQEQDQNRALEIQRRERLIAYQQANTDAVKAYNIELLHAQEAKTRAIQIAQEANRKELDQIYRTQTTKLDTLQKSAVAELKIITQTEQAKQAIFQNSLNQARAMLGQSTGAGTGPYNTPQNIARDTGFAYGGDPNYQRVKVNDGGRRESFNGVMLPRGLGLFIPMTSGRIDAGRGGGEGITINMPINGVTDPVAVGRIAREQVRMGLNEALGK